MKILAPAASRPTLHRSTPLPTTTFNLAALAWFAVAAGLGVAGFALERWFPAPTPDEATLRAPFVPWAFSSLQPEPTERRVFIALVLIAPGLILAVWAVIGRWVGGAAFFDGSTRLRGGRVARFAGAALAALSCGVSAYVAATAQLVTQVLPLYLLGALASSAGTMLLWFLLTRTQAVRHARVQRRRTTWRALGLAVALGIALSSVLTLRVFGFRAAVAANPVHLNTIMYSVTQVLGGQRPLVDFVPQYGLYAVFLQPWFTLIGLSTSHFVITLSGLQLLSMCALLHAAWRFVRSNVLLWLVAVTLGWLMMMNWNDVQFDTLDPYFQYFPVRVVFPALSVALAAAYLRQPTAARAAAGGVLGGLGAWWNVDSGVVTLAAWFILLGVRAVSGPRPGRLAGARWRPVGMGVAAATLALAAFYGVLCLEARRVVDVTGMLRYQGIFYGSGFFMVPMPLEVHPWLLVAGVYLLGLTHGLANLGSRTLGARSGILLYLSVLGLGLFSYYQGRSHDFNLVHTCWPALLTALILSDRLLLAARLGQAPRIAAATTLPLLALGVACALVIVQSWSRIADLRLRRQQADQQGRAPEQADAVAYLQRTVAPGEACTILSPFQALYHAESGRLPALAGPSLFECLLKEDLEKMLQQLRERRIGQVFFEDEPGLLDFRDLLDPALSNTLMRCYRLTGSSPAGNLLRWEPRADAELAPDRTPELPEEFAARDRLLASPATTLQSIGLRERRAPGSRRLHNTMFPSHFGVVEFSDDFAVEIRCATTAPQTPFGCLLSNHPGRMGHEGITIQQAGGAGDEFVCAFGDGTAFTFSAPFPLSPGRDHYLVISKAGSIASVFLDGQWRERLRLPNPVAASSLMMTIGDWVSQNRPFHGTVDQVKFHRRALTDAQVEANWRGLNLPDALAPAAVGPRGADGGAATSREAHPDRAD